MYEKGQRWLSLHAQRGDFFFLIRSVFASLIQGQLKTSDHFSFDMFFIFGAFAKCPSFFLLGSYAFSTFVSLFFHVSLLFTSLFLHPYLLRASSFISRHLIILASSFYRVSPSSGLSLPLSTLCGLVHILISTHVTYQRNLSVTTQHIYWSGIRSPLNKVFRILYLPAPSDEVRVLGSSGDIEIMPSLTTLPGSLWPTVVVTYLSPTLG